MSALNIIVQAGAAHMLTDRAVYDPDGTVRQVRQKVVHGVSAPVAVGYVGRADDWRIASLLEHLCGRATHAEAVVAALPEVARHLRKENRTLVPEAELGTDNEVTLGAVMWSRRERRARGFIVTSADPIAEPFALIPLAFVTIPSQSAATAFQRPFDPKRDLGSFIPADDGLALLEAQRATPWHDGLCFIGGAAELTTVGPQGVTSRILREWPDRVGERIGGPADEETRQ